MDRLCVRPSYNTLLMKPCVGVLTQSKGLCARLTAVANTQKKNEKLPHLMRQQIGGRRRRNGHNSYVMQKADSVSRHRHRSIYSNENLI